eukprot:1614180-Pleurochrysis_carterae.AAC.2
MSSHARLHKCRRMSEDVRARNVREARSVHVYLCIYAVARLAVLVGVLACKLAIRSMCARHRVRVRTSACILVRACSRARACLRVYSLTRAVA